MDRREKAALAAGGGVVAFGEWKTSELIACPPRALWKSPMV
jgi:hypothetical protein